MKVIEIKNNLEVKDKMKFIYNFLDEKINKLHPDIHLIDNIICDLIEKNINFKSNEGNVEKLKNEILITREEELKISFSNIKIKIKKISKDLTKIIERQNELREENKKNEKRKK